MGAKYRKQIARIARKRIRECSDCPYHGWYCKKDPDLKVLCDWIDIPKECPLDDWGTRLEIRKVI